MRKEPLGAGSPFGNQHHAIILANAPAFAEIGADAIGSNGY